MKSLLKTDNHPTERIELLPAVAQSASDVDRGFVSPQYLLLLATQFAFGFSFSSFFILPKFLATQLHASANAIGQVSAIGGIASVLAVPFIGTSIDRYGRQRFVSTGAFFQALSALGFIWIDRLGPLLYALRILHGLSFAFAFNAAATLVTDLTPSARLGRSLGIFGASMLVTNGIAPYLLEPLSECYGWSAAFIVAALSSFFATGLSFFIHEPERSVQVEGSNDHPNQSLFRAIGSILFCAAMAGAAFGTLLTFYQPFALEIGIARVSSFFIGFTLTAIFSRFFLGGLADRVGRREVSFIALIIYGCAVMAMAWLRTGMLFPLGAFFGIAHGLFYPALNALAVEKMSAPARGRVMTYFNGAFTLGFSASIVFLGLVAERFGYPLAFIIAGFFAHLAATVLWFSKREPQ